MEGTAITQIWKVDDFSGGEGDGFFGGPQGSYRAGENVETRMGDRGVRITSALSDTGKTYDGDLVSINPYDDNAFEVVNGTVYKVYWKGDYAFTVAASTDEKKRIRAWAVMKRQALDPGTGLPVAGDGITHPYAISQTTSGVGYIHRIDPSYVSADYDVSTFSFGNGRTQTSVYPPCVVDRENFVVFSYGNSVYRLDRNEIVTRILSLSADAEIVKMTYFQNQYKIYYNVSHSVGGRTDGYIAIWDGTSASISQSSTYENSEILNVVGSGGVDYVVFGSAYGTDLYLVSGLSRQEARINVEGSPLANSRSLGRISTIREGIAYFDGVDKFGNSVIYSYGKFLPGKPTTLVPENTGTISGLCAYPNKILVYSNDTGGANVGKIYSKSIDFNATSGTTASLVSYPNVGQFGEITKKIINSVDVGYFLNSATDSIKIYLRKDYNPNTAIGSGWIEVATITDDTKMGAEILANVLQSSNLSEFNVIEVKAVLNCVSGVSPILYSVRVNYTDTLRT